MDSHVLIEKIRAGEVDALVHIQIAVFPNLKLALIKRKADADTADEVCWLAWESFYNKCQQPDFNLTGNWIGYIYNTGLNIYYKMQERSAKLITETMLNVKQSVNFWEQLFSKQPDETLSNTDIEYLLLRKKIFALCLSELKTDCMQILKLAYWENKNPEQIAEVLKTSNANARQRKTRCLEALRKKMRDTGIFDQATNF